MYGYAHPKLCFNHLQRHERRQRASGERHPLVGSLGRLVSINDIGLSLLYHWKNTGIVN